LIDFVFSALSASLRENIKGRNNMKRWFILLFSCMALFALHPQAQAEPPIHLSPGDILGGLLGGAMRGPSAPIRLQAECSHELEQCWDTHGLNKDNAEQVQDVCWKEATKKCPKVCRDEYLSRRKAGMSPQAADPLFSGRHGEDTSCIPGVDERTYPGRKVNDSEVHVIVKVEGKMAGAEVEAVPVDDQGQEEKRTTSSPNYSRSNTYQTPFGLVSLNLPAGKYRLKVLSPDRIYHPERAFPEQVELISVQPGKILEKAYSFGLGRLVVKGRADNGKPLSASLNLKRLDGKGYGGYKGYTFFHKPLPLDMKLLSGKYRMTVMKSHESTGKVFNIEVKNGEVISKTVTFASDGM